MDASRGRRMASVTRIPGAGHLVRYSYSLRWGNAKLERMKVIEQKPDAAAERISRILDTLGMECRSRL